MCILKLFTGGKPAGRAARLICLCALAFCSSVTARAQVEVNVPASGGRGNVDALVPLVAFTLPVHDRVDLVFAGLYVNKLRVKVVQFEPTVTVNKYLTAAAGYNYIASSPVGGRKTREQVLRLSGTAKLPLGRLTLDDRNMVERRIVINGSDSTRYRNRLQASYGLPLGGDAPVRLYVSDEGFYEGGLGRWDRNRVTVGAGRTFAKRYTAELFYLREDYRTRPSLNLLGLYINIKLPRLRLPGRR